MTPGPSIVLAGGGTTGHVAPLLAMADELARRVPGVRLTAVGTEAGLETRLVPEAGLPLRTIGRVPLPRRPNADLLRLPGRFAHAVGQAGRILDEAGADAVVGVGGYVCTPVYLAARRRRIPVVVHEANARAGLANKVGARFAARVATVFEGTGLPRAEVVGLPMRRGIATLDRAAARAGARAGFGLEPDLPTLVVTGGSSGAASINATVAECVPGLVRDGGVQVLHVTGRGKAVPGPGGAPLEAPGYRQVEYVDGMERAYAAADLIVARSGAGTVCELAAVGLPSILVPLPVGNGEQRLNAQPLARAGGAVLVDNADFTPVWFAGHVLPLLRNADKLARMSEAAARLGHRDAAGTMAAMILDAAGHEGVGS